MIMSNTPFTLHRRRFLGASLAGLTSVCLPFGTGHAQSAHVRSWRQYVRIPWGQIHIYGMAPGRPSTQPPLICLHPTPYSGAFYREFQPLMAADRVVLCPDTPGFGSSDKPTRQMDISQYATVLADAIEAMGFGADRSGPVDVLGFHTGCLIAAEMALVRPDLVRRLVLPGIPFREGAEQVASLEENARPKAYYESVEALGEQWNNQVEWQGHAVSKPRLLELFGEELRSGPNHWWAYQAVFTYPCAQQFSKVSKPTLVVATGGDLLEPSKAAASIFPNATLVERPELDAPLFNQHYAAMAQIVTSYLADPEPKTMVG